MGATQKDKTAVISQNISYYDEISADYDRIMDADRSNEQVRDKVKEKLRSLLFSGWVLDFGGGTGLDLEWLTKAGYHILFCEPSEGMRQKAIAFNNTSLLNHDIVFLENPDFTQWQNKPPHTRKADAMIANFGVINYIPDLPSLFKNLAVALKPGAHTLLVTLKLSLKQRLKWHRRNALKSLLLRVPFVMYIPFNNNESRQTVFVHSPGEIRKAAAQWFEFRTSEPVTGFYLIHLTRK